MLTQRYGILLMFMFSTIFQDYVHSLCTIKTPKNTDDPEFPDPKKLYGLVSSYELKVEVNDIADKESMYATEYYNEYDNEGRVDSHFNGSKTTYLYKMKTNEGFIFGDYIECKTLNLSHVGQNQKENPPPEDFNVYDWEFKNGSAVKYGPFSMLSIAYEDRKNMQYDGTKTVRGLTANVWKRCADEGKMTIQYMLIDETLSKEIYGIKNLPVPLRITVEGNGSEIFSQSYEFIHFQVGLTDTESLFSIPFGKGCERLIIESEQKMPYRLGHYEYEAEIVYTAYSEDSHIYINNLKVVYDNASDLFAYTTIPWIAHTDSKFANAGDEMFRVFDVKGGYLYELDLYGTSCKMLAQTPEENGEYLYLPNGDKISLLNPNIIAINSDTREDFKYLGKGKDRGKKVDVFEKKGGDAFTSYISTHYYLSAGQAVISETHEVNRLIKVVYTETSFIPLDLKALVFNFYYYKSKVEHEPKTFDVTSCFKEENQTEWFQLIFPYKNTGLDAEEMQTHLPEIQKNVLKIFFLDKLLPPELRLPKVMMDMDENNVYFTAALQERVPYKVDFEFQINAEVDADKRDNVVGITTEEGCFQACVLNKKCKTINYCGVNCVLLDKPYTNGMGKNTTKCSIYKKIKENSQLTIDQINKQIAERIADRDFEVTYKVNHHEHTLKEQPIFRQGIAFGLSDYYDTTERIDSNFAIFKTGYNLKEGRESIKSKHSFKECQQECLKETDCESLSFCEFSSACTLSKIHGEDIPVKDITEDDTCIILTRNYDYMFNLYEGVNLVQKFEKELDKNTPEGCAKECMSYPREDDKFECRSFDLCQDKCYLHSTHIIDSKGLDVDKKENCNHYSKKYTLDFEVEKGKSLTEGVIVQKLKIPGIEGCAKVCTEHSDCKAFDFCEEPFEKVMADCYLSKSVPSDKQKKDDKNCNIYFRPEETTAKHLSPAKMESMEYPHHSDKLLADDGGKVKKVERVEMIEDTGYSKSLTGGIAFFLFLVGIAVGGAAMFGYGYYKANRRE